MCNVERRDLVLKEVRGKMETFTKILTGLATIVLSNLGRSFYL